MEKSVKIYSLGKEPETDLEYWLTKTPEERLTALEVIRQRYIDLKYNGIRQGFQRVYRVIERKRG